MHLTKTAFVFLPKNKKVKNIFKFPFFLSIFSKDSPKLAGSSRTKITKPHFNHFIFIKHIKKIDDDEKKNR